MGGEALGGDQLPRRRRHFHVDCRRSLSPAWSPNHYEGARSIVAASAAGERSAMTRTDQVRDEFVERLFASALGTMDVFTVYLGDRLGLYRMLAEHGPLTAGELAEHAGMYARYAHAWL